VTDVDVEQYRRRLLGIAYRMLGSMSEAEDMVQEAFLRWHRNAPPDVRSAEAWLVTVVTRLCIDRLRALQKERSSYPGPWLPEPVSEDANVLPERRAEISDDLTIALLVILDRMTAEERAAFILREVFQYGYDEIAEILQKREDACRQLVHRAKVSLERGRPKRHVSLKERDRLVKQFLNAMQRGDERTVLALIADDATWTADGGGKAPATRILHGAPTIAQVAYGYAEKARGRATWSIIQLLGEPAIVCWFQNQPIALWSLDTDGEKVTAFNNITNPEKLSRLTPVSS
jgi:RNA polymerase sigma-70 factor (ECF subfamily)